MTYDQRIKAWTDNIVSLLNDGVCWENFEDWTTNIEPTTMMGSIPGLELKELIIGRIVFHDLFCLVKPNDTIANPGTQEYIKISVIKDLLVSIWTRLNNSPERRNLEKSRQRAILNDNGNGGNLVSQSHHLYERETPYLNSTLPVDPSMPFQYKWFRPLVAVMNLGLNSYGLECFRDNNLKRLGGNANDPPLSYQYQPKWNSSTLDLVKDWQLLMVKRGAINLNTNASTPEYPKGTWGRDDSFLIAETAEDWETLRKNFPKDSHKSVSSDRVRQALEDAERETEKRRGKKPLLDDKAREEQALYEKEKKRIIVSFESMSQEEYEAKLNTPVKKTLVGFAFFTGRWSLWPISVNILFLGRNLD